MSEEQEEFDRLNGEVARLKAELAKAQAENARLAGIVAEYDAVVDQLSHHWSTHRNEYDRFDLVQQRITRLRTVMEGKI